MNDLIVLKDINAVEIFKDGGLDDLLKKIDKEVLAFVPDISTDKGRKEVASIAAKVARSKTYLDGKGKDYVTELKSLPKKIDSERKRMRDHLDALKDKVRQPLTEWEEAQEAEKMRCLGLINKMIVPELFYEASTSEQIAEMLEMVMAFDANDESLGDYTGYAAKTKEDNSLKLEAFLARKIKEEQAAKEAELKAKEAEEKVRIEREEQIRKEAAAQAKQEAEKKAEAERKAIEAKAQQERQEAVKREQEAKEAQAKAERDKIAAEERAKLEQEQAVKAERDRIAKIAADTKAKEEAERLAAERKASNKKHMAKINNEILDDFLDYMPEQKAKDLISKIAKGEINHVSIKY